MLFSTLGLGFLIGMQHATEADHVAAVCSVASGQRGIRTISRHGIFWGIGHTITLTAVGGTCMLLRTSVSEGLAGKLEFAVGVMLIGLGVHLFWRLWRDKVHFHGHRHDNGTAHYHLHSHRDDKKAHGLSPHGHSHPQALPWRTLVIGLVHGMAGSAALIVLTAATIDSFWWGLAYIVTFGLGTIAGMGMLSAIIAAPLTFTARRLTFANSSIQLAIGILTVLVGIRILFETAPLALASTLN